MFQISGRDLVRKCDLGQPLDNIEVGILPDLLLSLSEAQICCFYLPGSQLLQSLPFTYANLKIKPFLFEKRIYLLNQSPDREVSVLETPWTLDSIANMLQGPKVADTTFSDSDCLERDLESQISELNLYDLGLTHTSHFSQYTESQPSQAGFPNADDDFAEEIFNEFPPEDKF